MYRLTTIAAAAALALSVSSAHAAQIYFEGFEDPGFTPGTPNWTNFTGGDIERAVSGTAGITSSSGVAHGRIVNLSPQNDVFGNPGLGTLSPYTQYGGYSSSFGNGFSTSLDVYLDPTWSDGQGFDFSSAISNQGGGHLRDFIFHVGVVGGDLLVNGSNNTDRSFNAFKLTNENGGDNYTVTTAGWYTLEHMFYDDGGSLSVDLNLYDDSDTLLHTITRMTSDDIATEVGGNRYGWMVYNNIEGLAIDNTELNTVDAPEPATLALFGVGLLGFGYLRQRRRA